MAQEYFFTFLKSLGLIAFLMYGMKGMKEALGKSGNGLLDKTLSVCTQNDWYAVLFGTAITAVVQSSTAITVTVVGLVDSGKLKLRRAIGVILGANVGTCVTSWLLSLTGIKEENALLRLLSAQSLSALAAIFGILLFLSGREEKSRWGKILLSFALVLFSVNSLSDTLSPLAETPAFGTFFLLFSNPLFGILAGTLITALLQSSSASIGILQALSQSGAVTVNAAIPIILGQNIGTTITALIASAGASVNAKRSAFIHFYINLLGSTVFLLICFALARIPATALSFGQAVDPAGIAWIHTLFNVSSTLALMPFIGALEKTALGIGAGKKVRA